MGLTLDSDPYGRGNVCDSVQNLPGKGFTYCWSEVYDNGRGELETNGLTTTELEYIMMWGQE